MTKPKFMKSFAKIFETANQLERQNCFKNDCIFQLNILRMVASIFGDCYTGWDGQKNLPKRFEESKNQSLLL